MLRFLEEEAKHLNFANMFRMSTPVSNLYMIIIHSDIAISSLLEMR